MDILSASEKLIFKDSITDLYDTFSYFNQYGSSVLIKNVATETANAFGEGTRTYISYTFTAVVRPSFELSTSESIRDSIQFIDMGLLESSDYFIKIDSKQANSDKIKAESILQLNASETTEANKVYCSIAGLKILPDRIFIYAKKEAQ